MYNYVTQIQAATLSRNMYSSTSFTSDLMNSYAWDTAVVFLQTFDNREVKTKPYARQNSLNTEFEEKGTNNKIKDTTQPDKICNIWDMASNDYEWTTETYSYSDNPCVRRGGSYRNSDRYVSGRHNSSTTSAYDIYSFRPLLIL